jgi:polar amino acid transport system substrate-binding protein
MRTFVFKCIALMSGVFASVAHAEGLKILYEDRPPYYLTNDDGTVDGLVSGRVDEALRKSNIAAVWLIRPSNRQIYTIKRGVENACTPGWFKNPEREKYAKFSAPVYRDRPQVVAIRRDTALRINHSTLAALFADQNFTLGRKDGYSYGESVDTLIESHSPPTVRTYQNIDGMVKMLLAHRFDYFISTPEEIAVLNHRLRSTGEEITFSEMSDFPPGNFRYLMCSKKVDDDTIRRFNEALSEIPSK